MSELLAGTMEDNRIRGILATPDSRGMHPATFATLRTAKTIQDLTALLVLLEPPEKAEQTQIEKVVELLEAISIAVERIEQRLVAVESWITARSGGSPPLRPPEATTSPN